MFQYINNPFSYVTARQYIQLEMPYNHFHAFFTSPMLLIVSFKTRHSYSAMFAKDSILDVWLGSECASAVCVIIVSLQIFLHNLFCHFLVCGDSKLFLFQLFRFSMKLIPWTKLATKSNWKDWWHLPVCSYLIEGQKS